jgi:hypothetical protein
MSWASSREKDCGVRCQYEAGKRREPIELQILGWRRNSQAASDQLPKPGAVSRKSFLTRKMQTASAKFTLLRDANIHAKEYQLYLPDKELLRRKLEEWGEEVERLREVGE